MALCAIVMIVMCHLFILRWFMQWESVDTAVEDMKNQVKPRFSKNCFQTSLLFKTVSERALYQSVRSWAEYLEYDREDEDGDPSLVGGFTSIIQLLLDRMGVTSKEHNGDAIVKKMNRTGW